MSKNQKKIRKKSRESRRFSRKLVEKIDTNSDSKISHLELLMWTFKAIHSIDERENMIDDFMDIDRDHSKTISWPEFIFDDFGFDTTNSASNMNINTNNQLKVIWG